MYTILNKYRFKKKPSMYNITNSSFKLLIYMNADFLVLTISTHNFKYEKTQYEESFNL